MADKSIGRRMYENVMGTPEQNEAAEKRMEERDKKNPDSMPAKINKAAKAVTGKKPEPKMDYSYTIKEVEIPSPNSTGRTTPMGDKYKKGGMTASARADGIAQRGKTRGKMY
jgi:hypothetical protein